MFLQTVFWIIKLMFKNLIINLKIIDRLKNKTANYRNMIF